MALSGDRVSLTAISEDDLKVLFEWINDRELVTSSAPFSPVHEADHRSWFDAIRQRDDVVIFGIRSTESRSLVGTCQLLNIDLRHRTADLQIRIGVPEARGIGLGTEAVRLLLTHAFRDLDLHRVQLHVMAGNVAAIRVYEKAGFRHEGVLRAAAYLDGARVDVLVMGILRDGADAGTP